MTKIPTAMDAYDAAAESWQRIVQEYTSVMMRRNVALTKNERGRLHDPTSAFQNDLSALYAQAARGERAADETALLMARNAARRESV